MGFQDLPLEQALKINKTMNLAWERTYEIGKRLQETRIESGKTIETVSVLAGIGKAKLRRYEAGITKLLTPAELVRLAAVLETTPNDLLGWPE